MENKEEQKPGLGSFLPILLIGGSMLLLFQFMGKTPEKPVPVPNNNVLTTANKLADFEFTAGKADTVDIDTGNFVVRLATQGGRVQDLFIRRGKELPIPESVIDSESGDGKKLGAFEGTRGSGIDFQFHVYSMPAIDQVNGQIGRIPISPDWGPSEAQLGDPALNKGLFRREGPFVGTDGSQEVRYKIPVRLKGQNLEVTKIYKFYKGERFFRQISALRNVDAKDFVWGAPLYYRTFGDIGPVPETSESYIQQQYGRFYYYNGTLSQRVNVPPSNSMFAFAGCGERLADAPYSDYKDHPNTLHFLGSHSKYFFGYSRILESDNLLDQADGVVLKNEVDPAGKEAMTVSFQDFRLAASTGKELAFQEKGNNLTGGRALVRELQKRNDAIILDQQVYYGVRTDESHSLKDEKLALQEFGSAEPDKEARGIIYTSSFLALFSKVRDAIVLAMRFLHLYLGNYGWVIILIAVSFKLITFPLNQMQTKSMKKMSALKPELEKINEKYADNPAEKQKRTMEIYKKNNINPAKGCLPIVIQIPVFIALYSAFSESIELWRSPFILWMKDLSHPDTIYIIKDLFFLHNFHINILPLLMVASQLLQQKLTTVVMDPQQKIMMYMMPLIMIFFFWNMPSGVTLYWTIQNILAIVWQFATNKLSKDETA